MMTVRCCLESGGCVECRGERCCGEDADGVG